jgi:hypothetical protein
VERRRWRALWRANAGVDERRAHPAHLPEVTAEPVQHGIPLGVVEVPRIELGLADPQHGEPELVHHGLVPQDLGLQVPANAAVQLPVIHPVAGRSRSDTQLAGLVRDRKRHGVVGATHKPCSEGLPVDLPGEGEEELIDLVHLGDCSIDAGVDIAVRRGRLRQAGMRTLDGSGIGAHEELHRRAAVPDEVPQVPLGEKLQIRPQAEGDGHAKEIPQ